MITLCFLHRVLFFVSYYLFGSLTNKIVRFLNMFLLCTPVYYYYGYLALMPGGDHLNIIDPPGLTVMRIAGGRYRVTAAHRVVWTWMNEFAQLTMNKNHTATITKSGSSSPTSSPLRGTSCSTVNTTAANRRKNAIHNGGDAVDQLQIGDLVTMTIVDVFETDSNGKLLSYCPTFDNRAVMKTNATGEAFRKSSSKMLAALSRAQKSKLAISVANQASIFAHTIKKKVDKAVYGNGSGSSSTGSRDDNSASNSPHEATRNDNAGGLVVPDDDEYHHTTKNDKTNNNNTISNKLLVAPSTSTFDDNNSDVNIPSLTKSLKNHPDIMTTNKLHHHYLDDDDLERHEI